MITIIVVASLIIFLLVAFCFTKHCNYCKQPTFTFASEWKCFFCHRVNKPIEMIS